MGDLPTGTVTFLFTDIVQSTELVQRLGDPASAELIATYVRSPRRGLGARPRHGRRQSRCLRDAYLPLRRSCSSQRTDLTSCKRSPRCRRLQ